jgi:hypothetical protein
MCDLTDFFYTYPPNQRIRALTEHEISVLSEYKIPTEIIQFLTSEGISTYKNNFFWTILPMEAFQILSAWGLPGEKCYAFLRTAFGGIFFYMKNRFYRLNPLTGNLVEYDFDFCFFMNFLLTMDSTLESSYHDIYQKRKINNQPLDDEILAFVPALPLGGSLETSELEIVKMCEHLVFLAQLFGNKAVKI